MKITGAPLGNRNGLTHGKSNTRTYFVWYNMNNRCGRAQDKQFKDYGGRGIKVLWPSFGDFYRDMGDPPAGMTIERIDNDGHYCKDNCRWATRHEQCANKRNNRRITFNGQTKHAAEWCRQLGIKHSTLCMRLNRYGWSVERALCV